MSAKKAHKKKTITLMADDPEALKGTLKCIGGSQSDYWNNILANQAFQTLWLAHSDEEARSQRYRATVAALIGIGPKVDDAFFHKRCNERTTQRFNRLLCLLLQTEPRNCEGRKRDHGFCIVYTLCDDGHRLLQRFLV